MVVSTDLGWIQTVFITLIGLFDWVRLSRKVQKNLGMVCQSGRVVGVWLDKAYKHRMTGEGRSYQERRRERVQCPECGKYLERRSLATRRQTQNVVARGGSG